jgi:protein ImuB
LIERLRTRFGAESVYGLAPAADHRPEKARQKTHEPGGAAAAPSKARERPLWLLPEPHKLASARERPCFNGLLHLKQGPERIESGWWDGEDVDKDYFTASNESGQKLWVYFDRRRHAWYLHGFFA